MKKALAASTLFCGILLMVGVFLPWISKSIFFYTSSLDGYGLTQFSFQGIENPASFGELYLVVAGGIIMVFSALPAFIIALTEKRDWRMIRALSIGASFGALLSTVGILWFITRCATGNDALNGYSITYGFYMSAVGAILGLIVSIFTAVYVHRSRHADAQDGESNGIARTLTVILSGAVIVIGVFLPQVSTTLINIKLNLSGWQLAEFAREISSARFIDPPASEIYFILAGGTLMAIFAMISYIAAIKKQRGLPGLFNILSTIGALIALLSLALLFVAVGYGIEDIELQPWLYITLIVSILSLEACILPFLVYRRNSDSAESKISLRPSITAFLILVYAIVIIAVALGKTGCPVTSPVVNYVPEGMETDGKQPYGWSPTIGGMAGSISYFPTNRYTENGSSFPKVMIVYGSSAEGMGDFWPQNIYSGNNTIVNTTMNELLSYSENGSQGTVMIADNIASYMKGCNSNYSLCTLRIIFSHEQTTVMMLVQFNASVNNNKELITPLLDSISFDR